MAMTFERVIAPMARTHFLSECWTRRAVHLRNPDRDFDELFGWSAVDAILNARDLTFPKVKVSKGDRPAPPEQFTADAGGVKVVNGAAVLELFKRGASFGITGADDDWAPLREVIACMFDTFLESVHTNVYCSPANTQGFQCHFDLHEVFVLQIEGEKHWRVFHPTVESPVTSWKPEDAPEATVPPYLDVVLRKGDVLYVPRGHWHYAVAQDSDSLHVTVGITCRKGASFIDWLASAVAEDPIFRTNLPLLPPAGCDGNAPLTPEWTSYVGRLKAALAERLDDPDLAADFRRAMLRDTTPLARVSVRGQGVREFDLDAVRFERPAGRRHFFETTESGTMLVSGECEIELDAGEVPFFRKLFAAETFTGVDLRRWRTDAGADMSGVADMLAELVRSGLLLVARTGSA